MAAVITSAHLEPAARPGCPPSRPDLRLIQGGRSAQARRRTYARRRALAALVALVLLAAGVAVARAALRAVTPHGPPAAVAEPAGGPTSSVTARPGDTVWSIARRIQPEGDVRPLVDRLVALNGGSAVQAGSTVLVPAG